VEPEFKPEPEPESGSVPGSGYDHERGLTTCDIYTPICPYRPICPVPELYPHCPYCPLRRNPGIEEPEYDPNKEVPEYEPNPKKPKKPEYDPNKEVPEYEPKPKKPKKPEYYPIPVVASSSLTRPRREEPDYKLEVPGYKLERKPDLAYSFAHRRFSSSISLSNKITYMGRINSTPNKIKFDWFN
jgi:hypothetical protein